MKKFIVIMSLIFCLSSSIVSYAGEWKQDSAGWQYANDDGTVQKDTWFRDPSSNLVYSFDSNGYMQTGVVNSNGKEYYFNSDGSLARNCRLLDGRATDGNGEIFNDFNDGLTYLLATATDIEKGTCRAVAVSIKNECNKTFTVKANCELVSSGKKKKLYLYDCNQHKFDGEVTVNLNQTVNLFFVASDLSEFPVSKSDTVNVYYDYDGKDIWNEVKIQGGYRSHWSAQELSDIRK